MWGAVQHLDYSIVNTAATYTVAHFWASVVVYVLAEGLIIIPFAVLWFIWIKPEAFTRHKASKKAVVMAMVSMVLALAMKALIDFLFLRARPFVTYPDLVHLPLHVDQASFPSGHTILAFTIAFSLLWSNFRRTGAWLLLIACIIGCARVAAGVHYPTDILGGIVVAAIATWLVHRESSGIKQYLPNT